MKRFLKNLSFAILLAGSLGVLPTGLESSAQACPGCKDANETDDRRPRAYMYSILFMLGMPATVFTGFSVAFYRLSKKAAAEQMAQQAESPEDTSVE